METYLNVYFKMLILNTSPLKVKKKTQRQKTLIPSKFISKNPRFSENVKYIPLHSSYYHYQILLLWR